MGQQYLAAALLNHVEGMHIQSFDLATLLSDSTRVWSSAPHVEHDTDLSKSQPKLP